MALINEHGGTARQVLGGPEVLVKTRRRGRRAFTRRLTSLLLAHNRYVVRTELRGERTVRHVRAGRLRNRRRVAVADLVRNLRVVAGHRLLTGGLRSVDNVRTADLGDE